MGPGAAGHWERRTPVRRGLSSTRTARVTREIAPHWGAALPGRAGIVVVVVVVIVIGEALHIGLRENPGALR